LQTTLTRVIPSSQEGEFSKSSLISHPKNFQKSFYKQKNPAKIPTKKVSISRRKKQSTAISHEKKSLSLQSIFKYTLWATNAPDIKTHNSDTYPGTPAHKLLNNSKIPPLEKHTRAEELLLLHTHAGDTRWKEKHTI
jgi:hypothetical protein